MQALATHSEGQVIAIYSPVGGSGRTTTALNLACALSESGNPSCVVDFVPTGGDVHTMLGYTTDHLCDLTKGFPLLDRSLNDLLCSERPSAVEKYLFIATPCGTPLHFLPGLLYPHFEWRSHEASFYKTARAILEKLRAMYRYVVIDAGEDYNNPLTAAALNEADRIVVSVLPTRVALRNVQLHLPMLFQSFGGQAHVRWLPMMWNGQSTGNISKALGLPRQDVNIPFAHEVACEAIERCQPVVLWDEGPLGMAFRALAASVTRSIT